jgi:hypothetical protein
MWVVEQRPSDERVDRRSHRLGQCLSKRSSRRPSDP